MLEIEQEVHLFVTATVTPKPRSRANKAAWEAAPATAAYVARLSSFNASARRALAASARAPGDALLSGADGLAAASVPSDPGCGTALDAASLRAPELSPAAAAAAASSDSRSTDCWPLCLRCAYAEIRVRHALARVWSPFSCADRFGHSETCRSTTECGSKCPRVRG